MFNFPSDLIFRPLEAGKEQDAPGFCLQSSDHPSVDYVAIENESSTDKLLKHYVAVYDPAASSLQITQARKVTVRPRIRQRAKHPEGSQEDEVTTTDTVFSRRLALTEAFGSAKSKRIIQTINENRVISQNAAGQKKNPILDAIVSPIAGLDNEDGTTEEDRSAKPLPAARLDTTHINEVYALKSLVIPHPASSTLEAMSVDEWLQRISAGENVETPSRFVSHRVEYLGRAALAEGAAAASIGQDRAKSKYLERLRLLRYILLLLQVDYYLHGIPPKRRLEPVARWPAESLPGDIDRALVQKVVNHYCPERTGPSPFRRTLFHSTILALTLHIPPEKLDITGNDTPYNILVTDPMDISLDLNLKFPDAAKLFRELGCTVGPAKDAELARWGIAKRQRPAHALKGTNSEGQEVVGDRTSIPMRFENPKIAKLAFPIQFPKPSHGRPQAAGGQQKRQR